MPPPLADGLLRLLLGALALYHLAMGGLAVGSPGGASIAVRVLYGAALEASAPLRHVVRMLGLLAMALGGLLATAALDPAGHREIVIAAAALQGARALGRLAWREDLARALGVPCGRNVTSVALLVAEVVVLLTCLPPPR